MTVLGSLLRNEQRAIGQATVWGNWPGDNYQPTWAGVPVDSSNAMQLLTVYGCVRFISDGIATLPFDVYRDVNDVAEEMPIPTWLVNPVVGLDRISWLTQILSSLLLDGNAYLAIIRSPSTGGILELRPLAPATVSVTRERGQKTIRVNGQPAQWDILHIPGLMLAGQETGCSPVEYARQTIGSGMAAQEVSARLFGQGSFTAGVIEAPGDVGPDKAKEMAQSWTRAHSGRNKAHLPAVLAGGATWKETGVSPDQAQFLQTRGFTSAEIAGQMFLIDPTELGIPQTGAKGDSLTYQNLEQRNARKVQVTFLPWIIRIETAISSLLAQPRYVKLCTDGLLRGDTETRFRGYAVGIENRFFLPNEARALEDMPPIPGGDTFPPTAAAAGAKV